MSEHLTKLSLASLDRLSDGEAGKIIGAALKRAVQDCVDDPGDRRARKVVIELQITVSDGGTRFRAKVTTKVVLPPGATKDTVGVFEVAASGPEALFNPDCAKEPNQLVLFDEPGEAK